MTVITPFFDVVAGVAILAGRSSLLDTGVFKTANTNFTIRHILALGFIGVGVWNLWKIERAQDKLKKSLGAESYDFSWGDVKEMTDAKCPFCKKSSFRINNEEGYSFGLHEEELAGDFWLLECANCGAEWNQGGESTLDRIDLLGSESCDDLCIQCEWCNTCIDGVCENVEEEWGRESADFDHLCRQCHDEHIEELGMNAESFGAESCQHEWRKVNYGQHPKRFSHLWLCDKCNARIDSINMPSENRKVRPNSYTRNWKWPKQSYYFGAESFGAEKNVMDDVLNLQNMAEKYLPESIRDDAEAIEYSLQYIDNDKFLELDDLPKLNKVQELAGEVVLWTVEMFEAYEEGELNLGAESFGAEPMFVESDSLMVELMGFDGSYRTDGEVKVGYTTAAELGFEPKELKPVMWVWDDIEGYGAFMPTEKIRFIAEYFE